MIEHTIKLETSKKEWIPHFEEVDKFKIYEQRFDRIISKIKVNKSYDHALPTNKPPINSISINNASKNPTWYYSTIELQTPTRNFDLNRSRNGSTNNKLGIG